MNPGLTVVGISLAGALALDLTGAWIRRMRAHRVTRPPLPDVFLPDGWQKWHPDGRGNMRLYQWSNRTKSWLELPHRRFTIPQDEPAES